MKQASFILLAVAIFLFSGSATFAQETAEAQIESNATLSVEAAATTSVNRPVTRPTDVRANIRARVQNTNEIRADLKNTLQGVRLDAKSQRVDLRVNTKMELKQASTSTTRGAILNNALQERKMIRDERKASTTPLRAELKTLARQHINLVVGRFEVALKQFESVAVRIQTRIDKLKANGVATGSVEAALSAAISNAAQAQADVQAVVSLLARIDNASDIKTVRAEMDSAIKKATASIKATHQAFEKVARELVSLSTSVRSDTKASTAN